MQGDAEQLELAAAEMAQSAATLVQLERELEALPADVDQDVRSSKVQSRMEAAAMLERKMAAMEAQLAARRVMESTSIAPPPPPSVQARLPATARRSFSRSAAVPLLCQTMFRS
jgi:alpha-amylase